MFDLEQAIKKWKQGLAANQAMEEGYIAELEGHLRDRVEELTAQGIGGEDAFRQVAEAMGKTERDRRRILQGPHRAPLGPAALAAAALRAGAVLELLQDRRPPAAQPENIFPDQHPGPGGKPDLRHTDAFPCRGKNWVTKRVSPNRKEFTVCKPIPYAARISGSGPHRRRPWGRSSKKTFPEIENSARIIPTDEDILSANAGGSTPPF